MFNEYFDERHICESDRNLFYENMKRPEYVRYLIEAFLWGMSSYDFSHWLRISMRETKDTLEDGDIMYYPVQDIS